MRASPTSPHLKHWRGFFPSRFSLVAAKDAERNASSHSKELVQIFLCARPSHHQLLDAPAFHCKNFNFTSGATPRRSFVRDRCGASAKRTTCWPRCTDLTFFAALGFCISSQGRTGCISSFAHALIRLARRACSPLKIDTASAAAGIFQLSRPRFCVRQLLSC